MRPSSVSHPSGRRPTIGITPDLSGPSAELPQPRYELKAAYADAVLRAGGLPVVLPYSDDPTCVDAYLDRISGLLVTGGAFDIAPEAYGESARDGLGVLKQSRTAFEAALTKAALARNMPLLGVCGGMQLLNVVMGGSLFQDIGREVEKAQQHEQSHDRCQPHHPVEVAPKTHLSDCLGPGPLMVNSTHHQAVKRVGDKLTVCAVAPDGVVEAIEAPTYRFAIGVQWHPELLINTIPSHLGLYKAFVQRARDSRR